METGMLRALGFSLLHKSPISFILNPHENYFVPASNQVHNMIVIRFFTTFY
jgi:hypothetical protein